MLGGEEHGQERVVRAFERVRAVVAGGLELACPVCDPAEIVGERPVDLHRFSIVAVASSGFAAAVGKAAAAAWIVGPWLNARERRERRRYAARMSEDLKPRSREVTDGMERAGARAMLRAVGMTDADWDKPQIGVASSWNEVTPCNMPLDRLAKRAKDGVRAADGFPIEFVTIAISDGISMGHEGMRASLVSREVIADSIETMMHAERFDGMVTFAGCDKSLPGMLMAAGRLNLPSVFLYGGAILPGHWKDQALDIVSVFEAIGACAAGAITENELGEIERRACPTEGSCAGMFTANTMASAAEALGMCLPGSSAPPAVDRRRDDFAFDSGRAVVGLLEAGIRPRQIMTKPAFENAIAVVNALGGSTNAVLHLLAIAHESEVELELDDFNRIAAKVPHIADTKPHGKYHMADIDRIGGVQVVLARAARRGPAPRRLPDDHGQDPGREPRRSRPARARRRCRALLARAHPHRRRHRRAARARWRPTARW